MEIKNQVFVVKKVVKIFQMREEKVPQTVTKKSFPNLSKFILLYDYINFSINFGNVSNYC